MSCRMWSVVLFGAASSAAFAGASLLLNGDFEGATFAPWQVRNTTGGIGASAATFSVFDIDGPGPLTASRAMRMVIGRSTPMQTGFQGVTVTQQVHLTAFAPYMMTMDWAVVGEAPGTSDPEGTVFDFLMNGNRIARSTTGSMVGGDVRFGSLSQLVIIDATGTFEMGVRVTRAAPLGFPTEFVQYIDNVRLVPIPTPGAAALFGVAGLMTSRRRR